MIKEGLGKIKRLYPHKLNAYYTDAPGGSATTFACAAGRFGALFVGPNETSQFPNPKDQSKNRSLGQTVVILSACVGVGIDPLSLAPRGTIALTFFVVTIAILVGPV